MSAIEVPFVESGRGWRQTLLQAKGVLERWGRILGGRRPALTLLCVIDSRFIRADLNAHGDLVGELRQLPVECDSISDLPAAVATVLKDEVRAGRQLWLLHDGLPNHVVSVPTGQVAGLGNDQVGQALLFELEQLAGVSTSNQLSSQTLIRQDDGQSEYWISHAPKTLIAQVRRTARQYGSRFAGLLHPGGLPQALAHGGSENGWARMEIWPDVLIGVHRDKVGRFDAWVLQAGTKPRRVQTEIERWKTALGEGIRWETVGEGVVLDLLPAEARVIDFNEEDTLAQWLAAWGKILIEGCPAHIPVLVPPEDPNRERWLMAWYAAGALAVCLLHAGVLSYREHALDKDRAFVKMGEAQLQGMEMEIQKLQKQRDEYKRKMEPVLAGNAATPPELLAALRQRLALLLREVSVNAPDGVVIEEIHTKPNAMILKGVCLNAAEANGLALALEKRLRGLGWSVQPPRKKDLALDAGGGPWEFEILLADSGLGGFVSSSSVRQDGR